LPALTTPSHASKMRFRRASQLIQVKLGAISKQIVPLSSGRLTLTCHEVTLQKFALKMLLTSLTVRRRSGRIRGVEVVTTFLTLALLVSVGFYIWAHGGY
jgi:hypothetical protein